MLTLSEGSEQMRPISTLIIWVVPPQDVFDSSQEEDLPGPEKQTSKKE